tara:strand:+ start:887 stop:1099 length:213 start_codon:yes stop_codon:yes gene_type:complete
MLNNNDEKIDKIVAQMIVFIESQGYAIVALHPLNLRMVNKDQVTEAMENAGVYDITLQEQEQERITNYGT